MALAQPMLCWGMQDCQGQLIGIWRGVAQEQ